MCAQTNEKYYNCGHRNKWAKYIVHVVKYLYLDHVDTILWN